MFCSVLYYLNISLTGRRNQLNQATSYVDASFLYGHNDEDASAIRAFTGGGIAHLFRVETFKQNIIYIVTLMCLEILARSFKNKEHSRSF